MTKLDERWAKFKQELLPIIYVSVVQIWWCFNLQAIRLEAPWNTVLAVNMSIVTVVGTIFMFSFADTFAPYFNLNYLNECPYGSILKKIEKIIFIALGHVFMFFVWYKDIWHVSNAHYVLAYIGYLITFISLYRAIYRVPSAKETA
jgi:hypothetical protein